MALFISLLGFTSWFILLTYKYYFFGYYDWDLAIYSHAMWNLTHGSFYSSLIGMNFFANHANYIALLITPIYFLFPHSLTLIYLKLLSFFSGAFMLYTIVKKDLHPIMALILMILFIFFPANIFALLFEFDFESLSVIFLFLLYYFYREERFKAFFIVMILIPLLKENMSLIIFAFGIYILFSKKTNKLRWGLIPILFGSIYFYIVLFIITPTIRRDLPSPHQYLVLYSSLGLGNTPLQILGTLLSHPIKIFKQHIVHPDNLYYYRELFGPLLFIPLLNPQTLFIISPILLQNILAYPWSQHTIFFHYNTSIVPFVFLAAAKSLKYLQANTRTCFFCTTFIIIAFVCLFSTLSYKSMLSSRISMIPDKLDPIRWKMIKQIPPESGIIATFDFLNELSRRKHLYSFLNVTRGFNGLTGYPFRPPPEISYALIDFEDEWVLQDVIRKPSTIVLLKDPFFSQVNWKVKDAVEDIVLLEREDEEGIRLVEVMKDHGPEDISQSPQVLIDHRFRLLVSKIGPSLHSRRSLLPLTFLWKSDVDVKENYKMVLYIKKGDETVDSRVRRIGYSIYPTVSWEKGDFIKENYWLLLPPSLPPGQYSLEIFFFNADQNQISTIEIANQTKEDLPYIKTFDEQKTVLKLGEILIQ